MLCEACGARPPRSKHSIYCDDPECIQARARERKRAQRARDRERPVIWAELWKRIDSLTRRRGSGPVQIIEGVDGERQPMTGDTTQSCKCGLELRAPTGRELLQVIGRHNNVCLVLHRPDHWSVETMLRQKARTYRPDAPALVPGK